MVFSSVVFLFLFLPWTLIIHYFLDSRYRNFFLLVVSLAFYTWGEGLLTILIVTSIFLNYLGGLLIGYTRRTNQNQAKLVLAVFVGINILVLLYFKYFNFMITNFHRIHLLEWVGDKEIHLPIGISFYTFHIISYLIDVYRRDTLSQKNPFDLGLYIFLFPQLVAGPIIRYKDISQKIASRFIVGEDFVKGVLRFIRGLAKKIIFANSAAVMADEIFALYPADVPCSLAWLGIACYTLQIYFDFSGYSDMAIGLGKMLGFNFPENFNHPYIANSIREFWQRWHISLSTWFRDYLYIPLGGSKVAPWKTYRNLFIVFFVTGLWHGASWNFIAWGLFHGCFLVIERMGFGQILTRVPKFFQHVYMIFVVMTGWVFFRADNLENAMLYLKSMSGLGNGQDFTPIVQMNDYTAFILVCGIVFCTNIRQSLNLRIGNKLGEIVVLKNGYHILGYFFHIVLFLYCAVELAQNNYNPFIYFRF